MKCFLFIGRYLIYKHLLQGFLYIFQPILTKIVYRKVKLIFYKHLNIEVQIVTMVVNENVQNQECLMLNSPNSKVPVLKLY